MSLRSLATWPCIVFLLSFAQAQAPKASQTPQASLSISCDAVCTWDVDGEQHGALKKGEETHIEVLFGAHDIKATSADGKHWERTMEIKQPSQEQIRISFAGGSSPTQSAPDAAVTAEKAVQSNESAGGIPTFYARGRQVIVEAEAWMPLDKRNGGGTSWIPQSLPGLPDDGASLKKTFQFLRPPARGLTAKDFHIFDNGVEQRINYFKEEDFSAVSLTTSPWRVDPSTRGIWGTLIPNSGIPYAPSATYLIGYIPPAARPGECRTIQVVVQNYYVQANRKEYCTVESSGSAATLEAKLAPRMQSFANSPKQGGINVSARASVFWSSGLLSLGKETRSTGSPATDFTYVIEVHDSKAPASVQVATQFALPYQLWKYPCPRNSTIHILEMVYNTNGAVVEQQGDAFRCDIWNTPMMEPIKKSVVAILVPSLFDTQFELMPGEYEVLVVVSDGRNFGRARVPLRVDPLESDRLTLSDVVLNGALRDASWVIRDAAKVTPDPLLPAPLVSKNVQFLPVPDTKLWKGSPLSIYFEIYEPLPSTKKADVYYSLKIMDLRTGALVMNTGYMSAVTWIQPGNAVIPIGLKLSTEKLPAGSYRLEVQASDSAGQEIPSRQAMFTVE
jgi:hypothetical protein